MEIEYCEFPEDLFFDVENDTWFRPLAGGSGRMGITTVMSFLAGRISKINTRDLETVSQSQSIATIESSKYFGAIRSPVSGRISKFNPELIANPRLANDSPYEAGWIAEFEKYDTSTLKGLSKADEAISEIRSRIKELKIRCFKLLPDESMFSIGTECTTTLANLSEKLEKSPTGYVLHLVTDDPTSDIEMIRWSDQTKNELADERKEGNLFHFVVRKK